MRKMNKLALMTVAMTLLTAFAPLKSKAITNSVNHDAYHTSYYHEQLASTDKNTHKIESDIITKVKCGYTYWNEMN